MARAEVTVRVLDLREFKLLLWELRKLEDDMRVSADPYAERLTHALDRFAQPIEGNRRDDIKDDE